MYSLQLSSEQLEIRDTVRDFVTREVKPAALKADRLDVRDRSLLTAQIDAGSQLGLRTLALSEARGGAGVDALTCCIVTEELAAGDADLAGTLSETSRLSHLLFDQAMNDAQRDAFLPKLLNDDHFHLAFAGHESATDTRLGINYHRPAAAATAVKTAAVKSGNDFIVNGVKDYVANAPVAGLFAVLVEIAGRGAGVLLVPANAPGVGVQAHEQAWHHGACGKVTFKDCRVPAGNLLGDGAAALLTGAHAHGRGNPLLQALNLGIGRAAYEAALDYAHLRVQGGRPLIEHQAIATKLAEIAIRLEVARAAVWQTWVSWSTAKPLVIPARARSWPVSLPWNCWVASQLLCSAVVVVRAGPAQRCHIEWLASGRSDQARPPARVPVILYSMPDLTGIKIEPETAARFNARST